MDANLRDYFKSHEEQIVKIQLLWRARKRHPNLLDHNPTVNTIRGFLPLLDDDRGADFEEELELESLRHLVVKLIRGNLEKEDAVAALDIKITLLIRNRITLDDVLETTEMYDGAGQRRGDDLGLLSLDKGTRQRLEGYQHLFYLLQTDPRYLVALIIQLKEKDTVYRFIGTVVLSLYGYAQSDREEQLFLNFFKLMIKHEVEQARDLMNFARENPAFFGLVVMQNRGAKERQFLRDLLWPLIKEVLDQPDLDLDVDPLSIYRDLIRDEESVSLVKNTLPYDVFFGKEHPPLRRVQDPGAGERQGHEDLCPEAQGPPFPHRQVSQRHCGLPPQDAIQPALHHLPDPPAA